MFQFKPQEPPGAGAKRMALERIDQSIALLTDPGRDLDTAVHTVRKNLKRIRAVLRFLRVVIGEPLFHFENTCCQDAGRRLAPLRDSAVMVLTLNTICDHFGDLLPPDPFSGIRQKLAARQTAVRRQLLDDKKYLVEVAEVLHAARTRFEAMSLNDNEFSPYAGGIRRVYRRGRRRMEHAYLDPAARPSLFHDWRKRVKYLWYHLEMLEPIWPVVFQEMVRELHYASDLLGDAHDLVMLKELLLAEPGYFGNDPELPPLIPLLTERRRELELAARPYGRRLYIESPDSFVDRLARYWQTWQAEGISGAPRPEVPLPTDDWIGTKAAAAALDLSRGQVRTRLTQGRLPGIKVSGVWLIPRTAVPPKAGGGTTT